MLCVNWLDPWNDFRTANWEELIQQPEFLLNQTHSLLQLSA